MTVNDFMALLDRHALILLGYFTLLPVLSLITGLVYRRERELTLGDYLYSTLIYLSGIPGILALTLTFYTLFVSRTNLMEVSLILYFVPVISMIAVFILIHRKTDFGHLPGFERLSGLMLLIAIVCIATLFLYRLRIYMVFFGSMQSLLIAGIVLFIIFRIAVRKVFGSPKREPRRY